MKTLLLSIFAMTVGLLPANAQELVAERPSVTITKSVLKVSANADLPDVNQDASGLQGDCVQRGRSACVLITNRHLKRAASPTDATKHENGSGRSEQIDGITDEKVSSQRQMDDCVKRQRVCVRINTPKPTK